MKIVSIFEDKLWAFHYEGEEFNEYDRLIELWTDMDYLFTFLKQNEKDIPKDVSLEEMAMHISTNVEVIDDTLVAIASTKEGSLSYFFKPLHNREYRAQVLSLQKGREDCLRIYAIKIDTNTFVITGGAIKLPLQHLMQERMHTTKELNKLNRAYAYLSGENIIDEDSFFEFLNE